MAATRGASDPKGIKNIVSNIKTTSAIGNSKIVNDKAKWLADMANGNTRLSHGVYRDIKRGVNPFQMPSINAYKS